MSIKTFTKDVTELPLNKILNGDCIEIMGGLPSETIDLIFADVRKIPYLSIFRLPFSDSTATQTKCIQTNETAGIIRIIIAIDPFHRSNGFII